MDGLARQNQTVDSAVFGATVKNVLDGKHIVSLPSGRTAAAEIAASCLLTPEIGDRVLAAQVDETLYLLAVLKRHHAGTATIAVEGDVKMSFPSGKVEISAKDGMSLSTQAELSLVANRLGLSGESLAAAFQKIDLFGDKVESHLLNVKLFSKRLETKVDSAVSQFISRHAKVDGIDSLNAGSIKQTAKQLFSIQSMFAFLNAKKNVKIDGKQILIG